VSPLPGPTDKSFEEFSLRLRDSTTIDHLAETSGWEQDDLSRRVSVALGEVAQTLRILAGLDLDPGARVLEVGAGLGLTSAYLSSCGVDVTALEPAGLGFREHETLAAFVAIVAGSQHNLLPIGAAELDPRVHGRFDLLFSNNVLEHIADPVAALRSMRGVMSSVGVMIHSCPNYSVPFEPHFGLPLIPGRPATTGRVLPASISSSDVWNSLNFVTARQIMQWSTDLGLTTRFRSGTLATSIERLGTDDEFRARHRALAAVGNALMKFRAPDVLRLLPATWSTPMDFIMFTSSTEWDRVHAWLATE
jgi:2-polyprenyl-3-methyl-5-hydroxy-6-metoxy-1,4-benzoquinol methylase